MQEPNLSLDGWFQELVRDSVQATMGTIADEPTVGYISQILADFVHTDRIFRLRDPLGRRIDSVTEMVAEGDIRTHANSFEREREVHKHVGDFILFWSGVYPEFLRQLRLGKSLDLICDYTRQAKESYYLVSTFDYPPYDAQAPVFLKLSQEFEGYSASLRVLRDHLPQIAS